MNLVRLSLLREFRISKQENRMETGDRKDVKKSTEKTLVRKPIPDNLASNIISNYAALIQGNHITPQEFAEQALWWQKVNPIVAKEFQPLLNKMFPLRSTVVPGDIVKHTGKFLDQADLVSFATTNKFNYHIFQEGLSKAKVKEAEKVRTTILDGVHTMDALEHDTQLHNKDIVARVYHDVFSKEKKESKPEELKKIIDNKLIEQTILLHAFGLNKERTTEKICPENEVKNVINNPKTSFSIQGDSMRISLPLQSEQMLHLAQLFNAYYPLIDAKVYSTSVPFSHREETYELSLNTKILLEQALPVIRCLATKPSLQGDLSQAPDPSLLKMPESMLWSSLDEDNMVYRC